MPFQSEKLDGILHLTLDTPGSAVNIFNYETAAQTLMLMANINPRHTRAVVIRSAKPTSFINGVGLLLMTSAKSELDVATAGQLFRDAFAAVRQCPVPVITALRGMTWGCGVEFMLNAGYRIAADSWDTHFYMPELTHYLFVPAFRATRHLPETVGLERSIDMLLWGERWGAAAAAERGLINESAPAEQFNRAVEAFTGKVLRGEVKSCVGPRDPALRQADAARAPELAARARERIAELPATHQPVYEKTLDLLVEAATSNVGSDHAARELGACGQTGTQAVCKAALGFFFIRQMAASQASLGAPSTLQRFGIFFANPKSDVHFGQWARQLEERRQLEVAFGRPTDAGQPSICFTSGSAADERDATITIPCAFELDAVRPDADVAMWKLPDCDFIEFSERTPGFLRQQAPYLVLHLQRVGYQVALAQGATWLAAPRLVLAFVRPQVRYLLAGGKSAVMEATLRAEGFERRTAELIARVGQAGAARALVQSGAGTADEVRQALDTLTTRSPPSNEVPDPGLAAAVHLELLSAALELIEEGYQRPLYVDLTARELVGYPLQVCSLCSHLTPRVAAGAVERLSGQPGVISERAEARIRGWVARGRPFYR
jgi:enoyl-CoA hydratase/carnithine racemase